MKQQIALLCVLLLYIQYFNTFKGLAETFVIVRCEALNLKNLFTILNFRNQSHVLYTHYILTILILQITKISDLHEQYLLFKTQSTKESAT